MRFAVFTICARNYTPYARILMTSVLDNNPEVERITVIADEPDKQFTIHDVYGRVIYAREIGIPDFDNFAFRYDVTEFNTAIKPYVIKKLFNEGYDAVIYIDPDIELFSPIREVIGGLKNGTNAILTPHLLAPVMDDDEPNDLTILRAGVYNLGFGAFANTEQTGSFVDWWCARLEHQCLFNRLDLGIFVDQKWVDLLPSFVDNVHILRHPGYNVAYWNLMHRAVRRGKHNKHEYTVNGKPLVFFHFSGIVPGDRTVFSKHQNRFTPSNIGVVKDLLESYLDKLDKNGVKEAKEWPYAYNHFVSGERIIPMMRYVFREELEPYRGNPFKDCISIFNEPDPRVDLHGKLLITRLMYRVWKERPDLRAAFDIRHVDGQEGFVRWYLASAESELNLAKAFIDPVQHALDRHVMTHRSVSPSDSGEAADKIIARWATRILRFLRNYKNIYRHLPVSFRKRVKNVLLRSAGMPAEPLSNEIVPDYGIYLDDGSSNPASCEAKRAIEYRTRKAQGIMLVGYAKAEMGVGQGVRMHARALEASNVDFRIFNVTAADVYRQHESAYAQKFSNSNPYGGAIFHINADQVPFLDQQVPEHIFQGKNIAYWAWELSRFPAAWQMSFDLFDEIWVPSSFVQQSVSSASTKPVVVMPHAVERPEHVICERSSFGLDDDVFLVLSSFDFNSFMTRKNPSAAIRAFRKAFPSGKEKVNLLLKTHGGENHPVWKNELEVLCEDDPRIIFLDRVLSADELIGLQSCADVFLSLHRSEGFGLNLAESMALGKPVIATGYSGNMDFMTPTNSCLVGYELVPVKEGEYPFPEGQVWADPDIDQAAYYLRRVYENYEYRTSIGWRAKLDIKSNYSPAVIGERIKARLRILGLSD